MPTEWRDIPGYEGVYEASDAGVVRRILRTRGTQCKEMRPIRQSRGYFVVQLRKNGQGKRFYIHRVIALTFLGAPPDGLEVNHKDGNKSNNCVANLEYVTHQQNIDHSYRVLGTPVPDSVPMPGEKNPAAKLKEWQVRQIHELHAFGVPGTTIAYYFRIDKSTVSQILHGKRWKHIDIGELACS